jgi:hypothetical protein
MNEFSKEFGRTSKWSSTSIDIIVDATMSVVTINKLDKDRLNTGIVADPQEYTMTFSGKIKGVQTIKFQNSEPGCCGMKTKKYCGTIQENGSRRILKTTIYPYNFGLNPNES